MLFVRSLYVNTNCFCVCRSPKSFSSSCCLIFHFSSISSSSVGALKIVFLFPLVDFTFSKRSNACSISISQMTISDLKKTSKNIQQ